jgi:hypothetical protein
MLTGWCRCARVGLRGEAVPGLPERVLRSEPGALPPQAGGGTHEAGGRSKWDRHPILRLALCARRGSCRGGGAGGWGVVHVVGPYVGSVLALVAYSTRLPNSPSPPAPSTTTCWDATRSTSPSCSNTTGYVGTLGCLFVVSLRLCFCIWRTGSSPPQTPFPVSPHTTAFKLLGVCERTHAQVLPMNSGVEACESAVKLARRWGYDVKGIPPNQVRAGALGKLGVTQGPTVVRKQGGSRRTVTALPSSTPRGALVLGVGGAGGVRGREGTDPRHPPLPPLDVASAVSLSPPPPSSAPPPFHCCTGHCCSGPEQLLGSLYCCCVVLH